MKTIFLGTPDFSAAVLEKLVARHDVAAVVTGLDKPVGRGYELRPSPLKERALALGIPVLQYEKVSRDGIDEISAIGADVAVTAAFGQILSEKFISVFPYGVLNVHASLLPKYRGASPIQWALLNGDEYTGITIMKTVKAVDAGDILLQRRLRIGEKETAGELFDRLAVLGGECICDALDLVERGEAVFTPQNEAEATRCGMISKGDGVIDFNSSAAKIDCFVRAMTPWPSAFCTLNGKRIKVLGVLPGELRGEAGSVLAADESHGLTVGCNGGSVRLADIRPEGKGRMRDVDFLRGNKVEKGAKLQ